MLTQSQYTHYIELPVHSSQVEDLHPHIADFKLKVS